jgi:putative alpha-1,2-mannosidase
MNIPKRVALLVAALFVTTSYVTAQRPIEFVRPMMGTTNNGFVAPVAAAPFGMVELCPDTFFSGS